VGADAIILPSVLNTGSSNNPEAVVDFKAIKAEIGSLEDFKAALAKVKQNGNLYFCRFGQSDLVYL